MSNTKKERILEVFFRAFRGEALSVRSLADDYNVSVKSITRDINEIKCFLAEHRELTGNAELEYSHIDNRYHLNMDEFLSDRELLALIKVIIGARVFDTTTLLTIVDKLKRFSSPRERTNTNVLVRNELLNYHEVKNDCDSILDTLWLLSRAVVAHQEITISYYKMNRSYVEHTICPLSVMFSEYYFYLIAYKSEDETRKPLFFRVDRICSMVRHKTEFSNAIDFNEGELREKCQFMFPGELHTVVFEFSGPSLQAILDRLPNARVTQRLGGGKYIVEAQQYGDGLMMYLLSQGSWVKVLSPEPFVAKMRTETEKLYELYK